MSLAYWCGKKCYEFVNYGYFDLSNPRETMNCLFHIFAGVLAAFVAYNRNKNEGPFMAVGMAVMAFFFGFIYLLYWISSVVLQDPAYRSSYGMSGANDKMLGAYAAMVQDAK